MLKGLNKHSLALATTSFSALMLVGCGGEPAENATTKANTDPAPAAATAANTEAAPEASKPLVVDGTKSEAAQCVAVFLDSMRRGDEKAANAVLTTLARTELEKTDYELQPFGTPEGRYEIGRVGFPDPADRNVALVECTWAEPSETAGEPEMMLDIVCEVHKENNGWFISAMGVTVEGAEEPLVLDFENAASIQATIDAANGTAPANTNTPNNTAANTTQPMDPNSLPAMPNLPSTPNGQAMPPLPNGSLPPLPNGQLANPPQQGPEIR